MLTQHGRSVLIEVELYCISFTIISGRRLENTALSDQKSFLSAIISQFQTKRGKLSFLFFGVVILGSGALLVTDVVSSRIRSNNIVSTNKQEKSLVLAAEDSAPNFVFNVNVPSFFKENVEFLKDVLVKGGLVVTGKTVVEGGLQVKGEELDLGEGKLIAGNVLYSLTTGDGLSITTGQDPVITNTGVLSLQDKTGDLTLTAGTGITIDGLTIGSTIKSFKTITIGSETITAGGIDDNLTFAAGTGISLSKSANAITIAGSDTAGFTQSGTVVRLSTITNTVGIGVTNPASKMDINGGLTIGDGYAGVNAAPTNGLLVQGNVGIGTMSPGKTLDVLGTTNISGATTLGSTLNVTGTTTLGNVNTSGAMVMAPTLSGVDTLTLRASTTSPGDILNVTNASGSTSYLSIGSDGALTVGGSTLTNAGILESGGAIKLTNATDAVVGTAIEGGWTLGSNTFTYRRGITVTNTSSSQTLPVNHEVTLTLTGATAADICTNSRTDSNDIRIAYNTTDIARNITRSCSTTVTITFQLQATIVPSSSSTAYYLYYSNSALATAGSTYIGTIELDDLETVATHWASADTIQFPISQEATIIAQGSGDLKVQATTDNVGTFSASGQGAVDTAVTNFGFLARTIGTTLYTYIVGGSTDGAAANARSTIYRTSVNATNGNVNAGTVNANSLPSAVMDNATAIAVAAVDTGTGADGTLDLSLGEATGGCVGLGLTWNGVSTCTVDVQRGYSAGPSFGANAGDGSHSFQIPSGANNGKFLLVTGGVTSTTMIYDPATNTYSAGPALGANATTGSHSFQIPSGPQAGKVLTVLGGGLTTKLYDPATNTYSAGPTLGATTSSGSHSFQIPSGPEAGKFLTVLGNNTATTKLYDPATNTYSAGPALGATIVSGSHSFQIPSGPQAGKILTVSANNTTTKLYDPATNTYSAGPFFGVVVGSGSHSFQIPSGSQSGKFLLVGGNGLSATGFYDPATNTYSAGPDLGANAGDGSHSFQIPSGANAGQILTIPAALASTTRLYDPATNTYSAGPDLGAGAWMGSHSFQIPSGANAGKFLTIKGSNSSTTRLYDPATNTYSAGPDLGASASYGSHSFQIPSGPQAGKVLTVLGNTTATTRLYDPATNTYSAGPALGASASTGSHSFQIPSGANAGKFLTIVGNTTATTRLYDPATNTYSAGPALRATASSGSHSFQIPSGPQAGKFLTVLGSSLTDIYDPATNTYSAGPALGASASTGSHSFQIPSGPQAGKFLTMIGNTTITIKIFDPGKATFNFTTVNIPSGTTLTSNGPFADNSGPHLLTFKATGNVTIGGTVTLNNLGYSAGGTGASGFGPGGGGFGASVGCGGSYGGLGGVAGSGGCTAGAAYAQDDSGSGGGGNGFAGGGGIIINSSGNITINPSGIIRSTGGNSPSGGGSSQAGGGGSGGLIKLVGAVVTNSGTISATGGGGMGGNGAGTNGGGGGGGGRVVISYSSSATVGTITVTGGVGGTNGGVAGSAGTVGSSTSAILSNIIFNLGGQDTAGVPQSAISQAVVDSLDGSIGTFSPSANNLPQALYGLSGSNLSTGGATYLYAIGGNNGTSDQTTVYKFAVDVSNNLGAGTTSGQSQLATGISHHATVTGSIGGTNYIWVIGGENGTTAQNTIYKGTIDGSGNISSLTTSGQTTLPTGLYGHSAFFKTIGSTNYLFIIGGTTTGGVKQTTIYKATLDGSGNVTSVNTLGQTQLTTAISNQGSFGFTDNSSNNYAYMVGGMTSSAQSAVSKASIITPDQTTFSASRTDFAATDLSNKSDLLFWTRSSSTGAYMTMDINTGTSGSPSWQTCSFSGSGSFTINSVDTWEQKDCSIADISPRSAVTGVRLRVTSSQNALWTAYLDDIQAVMSSTSDTTTISALAAVLGAADLTLNAQGTGVVKLNYDATNGSAGAGGLALYNGGSTSLFSIDASGNASGSGNVTLAGSSSAALKVLNGQRFDLQMSSGGDGGLSSVFSVLTNGNVGIGTTAPVGLLNVNGKVTGKALMILNEIGNQALFTASASGVTKFVIDNNGNVGIGTATPTNKLTVAGFNGTTAIASFSGTTSFAGLVIDNSGTGDLFTASASGVTKFVIANDGNVGIGTASATLGPLQIGSANNAYVTTGGAWTNGSSRDYKENFMTLNYDDVLTKINTLDITEWNYKSEDTSIKHIGPIAEDFYTIFNVGNDSKHISTIDPAGIALAGIKALSNKLDSVVLAQSSSNTVSDMISSSSAVEKLSSDILGLQNTTSMLEQDVLGLQTSFASSTATLRQQIDELKFSLMTASISANPLPLENLVGDADLHNATVSGILNVLGRTTVNDLGITGTVTTGLLSINGLDGEINTLGKPLSLQSLSGAGIEMFGGKVVFATNGDIITKGIVSAKKLIIDTSDTDEASIGDVVIDKGESNVLVHTTALTSNSHIFVTPEVPVAIAARRIDSTTFIIRLNAAAAEAVNVHWWIVN